jgi:hypothetical protein
MLAQATVIFSIAVTVSARVDAQTADSARVRQEVIARVQTFYNWYVPMSARLEHEPAFAVVVRDSESWFTSELASALRADAAAQASTPSEINGLDFDPFLAAQDPCERYVVGAANLEYGSYRVQVFGVCGGLKHKRPDVVAEVERVKGTWVFADFLYLNPATSLLTILKSISRDNVARVRRSVAGECFSARLGKWSDEPTRPPLPSVFRLDTVPDPLMQDSAGGYRQVVPDWTETAHARWPAGWRLVAHDSLELRWSLGVIGIRIAVAAEGDTLRGHAVTFGDENSIPARRPRTARAAVVRVPCSQLQLR